MQTYILARSTEQIFSFMDLRTKLCHLVDVTKIGMMLFKKCENWEERLFDLPYVRMWVGNEIAFLQYWDDLSKITAMEAHAIGEEAGHRLGHSIMELVAEQKQEIWGEDFDLNAQREVFYSITNPLLDASPAMIQSHWMQFLKDYPQYIPLYPALIDFDLEPIFDWV
jgi:hypothetical protein